MVKLWSKSKKGQKAAAGTSSTQDLAESTLTLTNLCWSKLTTSGELTSLPPPRFYTGWCRSRLASSLNRSQVENTLTFRQQRRRKRENNDLGSIFKNKNETHHTLGGLGSSTRPTQQASAGLTPCLPKGSRIQGSGLSCGCGELRQRSSSD